VLVETSGSATLASFIRTILRKLGSPGEPTVFPGGHRIMVKGTEVNALRCWTVRDHLAHDQHIEIQDDVNGYVERRKAEAV
jgi:hypothetical protein